MKDELNYKNIKILYVLFIISGFITVTCALSLHQNLNSIFNGDYAIIKFQSRPYLEYEALVQWENHLTENVTKKASNDSMKKLTKGEEDISESKIKIEVFNEKNKLISSQVVKPSFLVLPDGSSYVPDSSLTIPSDGFHNYTVIFEKLQNRSAKSSTFPSYTVYFSSRSSEGNAVLPFMIGVLGTFLVIIGVVFAYKYFKHTKAHTVDKIINSEKG